MALTTQYEAHLSSAKCRFCGDAVDGGKLSVCPKEECQQKRHAACEKTLACGHYCGGITKEAKCLPCIHEECSRNGQQSASDFCNMCWTEDLGRYGRDLVLTGKCSLHSAQVWALVPLLLRDLHTGEEVARLGVSLLICEGPRITFNFACCPLCKAEIRHPALTQIVASIEELKKTLTVVVSTPMTMQARAVNRLKFEGMENDKELTSKDSRFYKAPELYAMQRFSYYMCFKCRVNGLLGCL